MRRRAANWDLFEGGGVTAGNCTEQRLVGLEIDFAKIVVRKSFAIAPDFFGIQGFVAIVRVRYKRLFELEQGGVMSKSVGILAALLGTAGRGR